jgi:hypothetical protein
MLALVEATQEFQKNYQLFANKNQFVLPVPAFEDLVDQKGLKASSLSLKDAISTTLLKIETNKSLSKTKWPARLQFHGQMLSTLENRYSLDKSGRRCKSHYKLH